MKKQRKHYQPDEKSPSLGDVYWTRRRSRPSTMNWACSPRFLPLAKRSSSKTGAVAFGQKHGRIIPPRKNGPLIRRKAIGERCRNFRGAGATLFIAQSFHWINARRAALCYGSYAGGNAHHALEDLTAASTRGLSTSTNLQQKHSPVQPGYGGGLFEAIIIGLNIRDDRICR